MANLEEEILDLINKGHVSEAKEKLTEAVSDKPNTEVGDPVCKTINREKAHYLLGNIFFKASQWKEAIEHYLLACDINQNSPAREKLKMTYRILEFYNKDIYGQ